jgi:D-alanine-D-alanine ligase
MTMEAKRKLRVIMLVDERFLPKGNFEDLSEKQRELRKTEFDVVAALQALGHEVWPIGVSNDVSAIRGAIDAHKPHIAFNLIEEFHGLGSFDQHVVSLLELMQQAYTGCNPRGLTLARDKALTKVILGYHGLDVPEFAIFPQRKKTHRPPKLTFPLIVKSLTEEGSVGISSASIVNDDEKLAERVEFIHRTTESTAIAEQFIDGREIYVGVMGNERTSVLPVWEMSMPDLPPDAPMIASDRAKWDPEYQRQVGLKTGPAKLTKKLQRHLTWLSRRIYNLLGMSGYARLDYRVTEEGKAYLLEANPNPQIARDEDFSLSAKHMKIEFEELIQRILQFGMSYAETMREQPRRQM